MCTSMEPKFKIVNDKISEFAPNWLTAIFSFVNCYFAGICDI